MEIEKYFNKLLEITNLSSYILNELEGRDHANLICRKVAEIFDVDACVIRYLENDKLYVLGAYGVPIDKLTPVLDKNEGLAGKVFKTLKPEKVYDINADPISISQINKRKSELKFVSYAGAPLIADNQEIGIIGIYRFSEKRDFASSEMHVLQLVSNQVALRLQNSKLFLNLLSQKTTLENEIEKRKLTEEELIKAKEIAEHSDRIKSEFLAQVSHEIRSPLSGMLSFISLIKESLNFDDVPKSELDSYFQSVELSGQRLVRTIDLLLNVSEVQKNAYKPIFEDVDLPEVIHNVVIEYKLLAKNKNIDLLFTPNANISPVHCDRYSLIQIISNLVDNAIKYTKQGSIIISLDEGEEKKPVIAITDTGIGMSDEYLKELFKPFSQEETGYTRKFDGSGLGLSLVSSYCTINKIDISVESKKNSGTTFLLCFQAVKE